MTRQELINLMVKVDQLCDSKPAVIDYYESLLHEFQEMSEVGEKEYTNVDRGCNTTVLLSYIKHYKTLLYVLFAYTDISSIIERKAQSELTGWLDKHKASTENIFLTCKEDDSWN